MSNTLVVASEVNILCCEDRSIVAECPLSHLNKVCFVAAVVALIFKKTCVSDGVLTILGIHIEALVKVVNSDVEEDVDHLINNCCIVFFCCAEVSCNGLGVGHLGDVLICKLFCCSVTNVNKSIICIFNVDVIN